MEPQEALGIAVFVVLIAGMLSPLYAGQGMRLKGLVIPPGTPEPLTEFDGDPLDISIDDGFVYLKGGEKGSLTIYRSPLSTGIPGYRIEEGDGIGLRLSNGAFGITVPAISSLKISITNGMVNAEMRAIGIERLAIYADSSFVTVDIRDLGKSDIELAVNNGFFDIELSYGEYEGGSVMGVDLKNGYALIRIHVEDGTALRIVGDPGGLGIRIGGEYIGSRYEDDWYEGANSRLDFEASVNNGFVDLRVVRG